jgi:hypothetical protein
VVLAAKQVEQAGDAAADQLQRTVGQRTGLDDDPDRPLGDVGGRGCGFDDGRDPGQEGGGQFLQHPPDREVEGVDLKGEAVRRRQHVPAGERARPSQYDGCVLGDPHVVREFPAGKTGEHHRRADPTVHIDRRVTTGAAGPSGQGVQLGLPFLECRGGGLHGRSPGGEGQLLQSGPPHGAGVADGGLQVQPVGGDPTDGFAGDGIEDLDAVTGASGPVAGQVAGQDVGPHRSSLQS